MNIDIVGLLMIFGARILDVSCGTFRILLLVRGRRFIAACIGFFEVMLYMVILGYVIGGGKPLEIPQLIAYCGGYAMGNFLGAFLEERLLNAFVLLEVISERNEKTFDMIRTLREEGFGTTVLTGEGRTGVRYVIKVICGRKDIQTATRIIGDKGFVFVSDVKGVWGGHFRMKRK
jgi:uncharacterized protein YebE (UPF0316 family)